MSRLVITMVPVTAAALSAIVIFVGGAATAGGWVAGLDVVAGVPAAVGTAGGSGNRHRVLTWI